MSDQKVPVQCNLFGGRDCVKVNKATGRVRALPTQYTLEGEVEVARTRRNRATVDREAQDAREGKVAR